MYGRWNWQKKKVRLVTAVSSRQTTRPKGRASEEAIRQE